MREPLIPIRTGPPEFKGWSWLAPIYICPKQFELRRRHVDQIDYAGTRLDGRMLGLLCHDGNAQTLVDEFIEPRYKEAIALRVASLTPRPATELVGHAENICKEYASYWGMRPRWKVLATEYQIVTSIEGVTFGTIIDNVVRDPSNRVWLVERKHEARDVADGVREHRRSGQILNEMYLAKWLDPEFERRFGPLHGLVVDQIDTRRTVKFGRAEVEWFNVEHALAERGWFFSALSRGLALAAEISGAVDRGDPIQAARSLGCALGRFGCGYWKLCAEGGASEHCYQHRDSETPLHLYDTEAWGL